MKNKLKSNTGASLMVALLLFMVCAVVGSVILAAASSSAGRASRADTSANEQRYSLESAAQTLIADLAAEDAEDQADNPSLGNADFSLTQNWNYHLVRATFAIKSSASALNLSGDTYHVVGNLENPKAAVYLLGDSAVTTAYSSDSSAVLSYGDPVLQVDDAWQKDAPFPESAESQAKTYRELSAEYPQLLDTAAKTSSAWTDQWTGGEGDYVGTTHSGSPATIQEIRDQMVEALIRHDWDAIAQNTRSAGAGTDPWNGVRPASLSYGELKAKLSDGYTVTTDPDNPLVMDPPAGSEKTILPVYAALSLDSTGRFVIHLTCGGETDADSSGTGSTGAFPETGSELWVIYAPVQDESACVTYTQSLTDPLAAGNAKETNPLTTEDSGSLVYQESYESQIQTEADSEDSARSEAQRQIEDSCSDGTIYQMGSISSEAIVDPDTGEESAQKLYTVPYTVYTKEPAVVTTVTTIYRSVTVRFTWDAPEITQDASTANG